MYALKLTELVELSIQIDFDKCRQKPFECRNYPPTQTELCV